MTRALTITVLLCCTARAETVQGTVLDAATRQPVGKASVTITALSPDRSYAVAITNSAGQFTLNAIPQGRYRIVAGRTGYLSIPYGALAPQRPGVVFKVSDQSRAGITLLLIQANSVTGTVTDPEGDGILGVQITLYKQYWERGRPRLRQVTATSTDNRGKYELANVLFGEYIVAAKDGTIPRYRPHPVAFISENLAGETFDSQKYPTTLIVHGNDLPGIDFHLNYVPRISLHGTITGVPPEARNVSIGINSEFLPDSRGGVFSGVKPDHSFQISGIAPGLYRLTARAGDRRTVVVVNLTAPDTEVNFALTPGTPLAGTLTVEGPGADRYKSFRIALSSAGEFPQPDLRADVEDGEFEFDEVPSGTWDIGVIPLPPGCYIKSMHLGSKDVLLEDMEIGPQTRSPLAIVISTEAPKVEGTVEPPGPATILANMSGFFTSTQSDEQGHFTLRGLHPGTYRFYAFRDIEPESWQDPKMLRAYEPQSKTAELKEGATETFTLPLIGAANP